MAVGAGLACPPILFVLVIRAAARAAPTAGWQERSIADYLVDEACSAFDGESEGLLVLAGRVPGCDDDFVVAELEECALEEAREKIDPDGVSVECRREMDRPCTRRPGLVGVLLAELGLNLWFGNDYGLFGIRYSLVDSVDITDQEVVTVPEGPCILDGTGSKE